MPPTNNESFGVAVLADGITAYIIEYQLETTQNYPQNNNKMSDGSSGVLP